MRAVVSCGLLCFCLFIASAQSVPPPLPVDSDGDGLSDVLEDTLLAQFEPIFMVSEHDCSVRPAAFVPSLANPVVRDQRGTIYGQAFPRPEHAGQVELHFYHLWRSDCGQMSHNLDAEHVSALLVQDDSSQWKAVYWYAAAHEDTVCDASQIARSAQVDGELHGPVIWISHGKHASFLSRALCTHGCGGDRCGAMEALGAGPAINLGEPAHPMNGAAWAESPRWPLSGKMSRSDFPQDRIARIERISTTPIAWANPEKRPLQATILGGNDAVGGAAVGLQAADQALSVAGSNTGTAMNAASGSTGQGLGRTAQHVGKALRATARKLGLAP